MGHVPRGDDRDLGADRLQAGTTSGERSGESDVVTYEADPRRVLDPRLGAVRRENDDDLLAGGEQSAQRVREQRRAGDLLDERVAAESDRKSTRLNSSHRCN